MQDKKGLLMRVGIDQTFGRYNAPINPSTNDYLYMPIPQGNDSFKSGMETTYEDLRPAFSSWCQKNGAELEFPTHLEGLGCHLDPDFDYSTYGDQGTGRGLRVGDLSKGDFLAFFASFKPTRSCGHHLVYALYGIMVVDRAMKVADVAPEDYRKNAHTRVQDMNNDHWVVFAEPSLSGRFRRALPIGEFRNGSYRVTQEILEAWGGLGVKDGFIQRSVCPPLFSNPEQFLRWLDSQSVELIQGNWN